MTTPKSGREPSDSDATDRARGREWRPGSGRTAPPWWPQGEAWPPHASGSHRRWGSDGPHRGAWSGRGRWRPFGCLFLLFGLFAAGTMVVGLWAAAAIVGLVEAPTIVVAAGIVAFFVIAIGAFAAARGFRRLSQPLDELIEASGRIESGDYSARVSAAGGRETRSLSRAFNQMSEQLETSDLRRRAFLADVAHELRTPLTVMQGQLEAIEDGVYQPDQEHISALLSHTRSMARLVEDLRTISLAEVGALRLDLRMVDVASVSQEVVGAYQSAARARGIELRADASTPIEASADAAALRRVLGNLVSNAIDHTLEGGRVTVRVVSRGDGKGARIEVTDDGEGMPADLAERAFERFAKGPGSGGTGLGLAIAHDLIEAQRGSIELVSAMGAGTTVRIDLGVADAGD